MLFPETLLEPISGTNPSGEDLSEQQIWKEIEHARKHEDGLSMVVSEQDAKPKRAEYERVSRLCQEALTRSKDLQVAVWLTEAELRQRGIAGLRAGLLVCHGLMDKFWDTLYPVLGENGYSGRRAKHLNFLDDSLWFSCKLSPITKDGYSFHDLEQSRTVPAESEKDKKKDREKAIKEGKIPPEVFHKSFESTPKAFYAELEADFKGCKTAIDQLEEICKICFPDDDPDDEVTFGKLRSVLDQISDQVNIFLERKRELEPDPVPASTPVVSDPHSDQPGTPVDSSPRPESEAPRPHRAVAPTGRQEALETVAEAAAYLRKVDPLSPAPFLMMRGLRWGELRAAAAASNEMALEAPSTELRVRIKTLAVHRKWSDLIQAAESAMALPASRAWLDLQRLVVEACRALGSEYDPIATAICSEIRALVCDLPNLVTATLTDDTPAANPETCAWIESLMHAPAGVNQSNGWRKNAASWDLALEAFEAKNQEKAFQILHEDLERQHSGRGRFRCKQQLVDLCIKAGKETVAQPLLDDLAAALEKHNLEDWEDQEFVTEALLRLMNTSKRMQSEENKKKLFEKVCRLNPGRAIQC
jgi:type VI secretion system protein ImpA